MITKLQFRVNYVSLATVYVIVFFLVFDNIYMGLGEDADSDAILGAVTKIIDGEYYPSRVYGVPGYEFIAALLYKYNGIVMVNLYSFILYVLYVFIVFKIIREFFENNGFYIFIAMCFHPVVLLNATVMMETMQIVALASLAILYYLRLFSCQRIYYFVQTKL